MALGWISLHRQLQEHWLWEDKPFTRGQAWIDMLLMANHADKRFLLGNEVVEVKAGSFITSELKLMDKWGWSKTKVRSFLALLENDKMIVKKSDRKKTTITIENYSFYSNCETTKELQKNCKRTAKEPQKNTNNNDNNDNNVTSNIYIGVPADLKDAFVDFATMRKKIKKPITSKQTVTRILNKLDKLATTTEDKIAILNQSTDKCWQDVYELKGDKPNGQYGTNTRDNKSAYDELGVTF